MTIRLQDCQTYGLPIRHSAGYLTGKTRMMSHITLLRSLESIGTTVLRLHRRLFILRHSVAQFTIAPFNFAELAFD
jgi:hypothetical protein